MVGKECSPDSVPGGYSRHKEHRKRTKTANVISPGITSERQHRMQRLHWELKAAEKGKAQPQEQKWLRIYSAKSPYKSLRAHSHQEPTGGGVRKTDFSRFIQKRV